MDNQVRVQTTDQRPVPAVTDIVITLDQFHVCVVKFNRLGTLIAAGGVSGTLALIDFTTKFITNIWNAHAVGVTNIAWTRDGSKIFSTGLDNVIIISDVSTTSVIELIHIGPTIVHATLNPRDSSQYLLYTRSGITLNKFGTTKSISFRDKDAFGPLIFDHRGKHLIGGTSKGQIKAFTLDGKRVSSASIDSSQVIRYIHATKKHNLIIVIASDVFIRIYDFNDLLSMKNDEPVEPLHKLYDPSGKTLWHSACASGDADYIAALSASAHEVTIFERATEMIVTTLCQSKKEIPVALVWHPAKPAVVSVSNGSIYIWKQRPRPCWAAYAPDFTELGENLVYKEKESEFDVDDEDFPKDDELSRNVGELIIDVETVTAPSPLCSSDDEDPNKIGTSTFFINASPAVIPLKSTLPSQMRRKPNRLPPIQLPAVIPEVEEEPSTSQPLQKEESDDRPSTSAPQAIITEPKLKSLEKRKAPSKSSSSTPSPRKPKRKKLASSSSSSSSTSSSSDSSFASRRKSTSQASTHSNVSPIPPPLSHGSSTTAASVQESWGVANPPPPLSSTSLHPPPSVSKQASPAPEAISSSDDESDEADHKSDSSDSSVKSRSSSSSSAVNHQWDSD